MAALTVAAAAGRSRLPDFIIGGAMKSGTTSIHHLLGSHPGVFIPEPELFFFDCDDVVQHPQLLRRGYALPDYGEERRSGLHSYRAWFDPATEGQLVGEDTTTYLASEKAPERIAELLPDVKLIFVLRDPVERAYSHYWHLVRHGLAFFTFDATLEHMPGTIVQRGFYKRQLDRYFRCLPREQVHVVIFEEFRAAPQRALDALCTFLNLPPAVRLPVAGGDRQNFGAAIRHPRLYRGVHLALAGSTRRSRAAQTPAGRPSGDQRPGPGRARRWARSRVFDPLAFDARTSYPPLDGEMRERLGRFYAGENSGLAELLDRDLATLWPVPPR